MKTPKYTASDVAYIKEKLVTGNGRDLATFLKVSYQTIMKIKRGTYVPNTRPNARSGLPEGTSVGLVAQPTLPLD